MLALRQAVFQPDEPGSWCPRCGSSRCRRVHRSPALGALVRLGAHEGALREWVIAIKHNQWVAMGETLGRMLGEQVARCHPALDRTRAVVVPVPMPWIRRMERGMDHSAIIAGAAARALRLRCVQPLRQRGGGTQVQSNARAARMARVGRFMLRRSLLARRTRRMVCGATVIVVDDVRTTGATLAQVAAELLRAGAAQVIPAVLSVRE